MDITRDNLLSVIQTGLKEQSFSIAGLEKLAGVPKDTIRDFLRGKTQILRADKLQKILRILRPENRLAVHYQLDANAKLVPVQEGQPPVYVDSPPGVEMERVQAVLVRGDAMAPVFHEGWVIYYSQDTGANAAGGKSDWKVPYGASGTGLYSAFIGKPCVIRLKDGSLYLRTLKQGTGGKYTLAAYNAPDLLNADVAEVYKIIFIKPA